MRSPRAGGLRRRRLAALAWAAFVSPLPRLTYNPSNSVAVGWYRIEPFDPRTASLPRPLSVDSIVLVPLPDRAAMLAAQRAADARAAAQTWARLRRNNVCIVAGAASGARTVRLPLGRPLPSLQLCRRLEPGELFLRA